MIPSVVAGTLSRSVEDVLRATFPVSTPAMAGLLDGLFGPGGMFKGPYLSINLPPIVWQKETLNLFPRCRSDIPPIAISRRPSHGSGHRRRSRPSSRQAPDRARRNVSCCQSSNIAGANAHWARAGSRQS